VVTPLKPWYYWFFWHFLTQGVTTLGLFAKKGVTTLSEKSPSKPCGTMAKGCHHPRGLGCHHPERKITLKALRDNG